MLTVLRGTKWIAAVLTQDSCMPAVCGPGVRQPCAAVVPHPWRLGQPRAATALLARRRERGLGERPAVCTGRDEACEV